MWVHPWILPSYFVDQRGFGLRRSGVKCEPELMMIVSKCRASLLCYESRLRSTEDLDEGKPQHGDKQSSQGYISSAQRSLICSVAPYFLRFWYTLGPISFATPTQGVQEDFRLGLRPGEVVQHEHLLKANLDQTFRFDSLGRCFAKHGRRSFQQRRARAGRVPARPKRHESNGKATGVQA